MQTGAEMSQATIELRSTCWQCLPECPELGNKRLNEVLLFVFTTLSKTLDRALQAAYLSAMSLRFFNAANFSMILISSPRGTGR